MIMRLRRLLWQYIIRHFAHKQGFLDPIALLAQLRKFAPPSEVSEPIELLRAGAIFHARGLINRHAIQHNLDWIWPYWVEQQFNPHSDSFLPRGFSITHVNLTHRNWTAFGLPDCHAFPLVDPRGLITPLWDGWSLDCWIVPQEGKALVPSRLDTNVQRLVLEPDSMSIHTESAFADLQIRSVVEMRLSQQRPICEICYEAYTDRPAWLVIALRPYNPEGISFIRDIQLDADRHAWQINKDDHVHFQQAVEHHAVSNYQHGDVFGRLHRQKETLESQCDVGLATAAAMYALEPETPRAFKLDVPLQEDSDSASALSTGGAVQSWSEALDGMARLEIPDQRMQFLYEAAVRTLVLLSPDWTYPGPYTYKRFWYRDAAFLVQGLLGANLQKRAEQVLDHFPEEQNLPGYFHSQEGEWDTNGEALWSFARFCELTGKAPKSAWREAIEKGARWIVKKRLSDNLNTLHAGLFPPGFSAEHLGNIDYYYWDNFWNVAGLRAAAALVAEQTDRQRFEQEANILQGAIEYSLEASKDIREYAGIPASPYRRMDSGAVGSLVAGYPLKLLPANDERLLCTVEFLREHCFMHGAFFQDMIHSGINAYLSLHVAQIMLRAGDQHFFDILQTVGDLASPTGQWPEAIHPRTQGGCMGDGHHAWASAEWIMMLRNMFVQEENGTLRLAGGIPHQWLKAGERLTFGPTPTAHGPIRLHLEALHNNDVRVSWEATWRGTNVPKLDICVPGYAPLHINTVEQEAGVVVQPSSTPETQRCEE